MVYATSHVYWVGVCTVFACMYVRTYVYMYLCSFDVEVCFTVEPTGVEGDAFQGGTVGESANKTACVACIRVNPDFFPSFAIHCSYELYT